MAVYLASAAIDASPEHVWGILTSAAGYQDWNPEIIAITGTMSSGARIVARVKLGSGALRSVPMRVTAFEAPSRMEWTGGLPFGLFVGRRTFTITPNGTGSMFRMHVSMTGPLSGPTGRSVGDRQPEVDDRPTISECGALAAWTRVPTRRTPVVMSRPQAVITYPASTRACAAAGRPAIVVSLTATS